MKKIISIGIGLLVFTAGVCAEDKTNWTGFYGSAMLGRDWGNINEGNGLLDYTDFANDTYKISNGIGASMKGWSGNIKLGYNKQIDSNLIGIELGGTWQNAKFKNEVTDTYQQDYPFSDPAYPDSGVTTANTKINAYGTIAPKLGHIFNDKTLVYAYGGAAIGRIKRTIYDNDNWFDVGTIISDTQTKVGYVLGFGAEYKLNDKWSLRGNYEYVDFGNINFNFYQNTRGYASTMSQSNSINLSNLSAGISYTF